MEEVKKYLADASALVKLFIDEDGSEAVKALLREVHFVYTTLYALLRLSP